MLHFFLIWAIRQVAGMDLMWLYLLSLITLLGFLAGI